MHAPLTLGLGSAFLGLALGLGLALAGPASAKAPEAERPDEVALRYYASQKQTERVTAETARLRRRHPGWEPPADLWTAQGGAEDEGVLWDLFGAGRIADLRAAVAERARTEPGWAPSAALKVRLAQRELRDEALALARAGRWAALAALADRRRADVAAGDAELIWAVAEAWGRTEQAADAATLLRGMMAAPRFSPEERRVALLRAMPILEMGEIDRLAALGRPGDFEPIRIDLVRARIGAVLHDEAGQSVGADDLAAFAAHAEAAADPNQAGLVAWYAFKRRDWPEALQWFKRAIARGGDATVAHGLAHTLRQLGRPREAEDVAYAWREPLVNNTLLFIDLLESELTRENPPAIEPERLARYAEVTAATASGEGAQALAWYAYNTCQFDTALGWFRRAVAWYPKEATVYGYALTLRRLHQQRAFLEVVNRYDGLFPRVVGLLFETGRSRPTPCDPPSAAVAPASAYLDLRRGADGPRSRVPQAGTAATEAALPVRRGEFPVPVSSENDLRVAAANPVAMPAPRWPERSAVRGPIVARRVPGVGAMPYERFGFSLLRGWDGSDAPGLPAAERPVPQGTLWSDERAAEPPRSRVPSGSTAELAPAKADRNQTAFRIVP